MATFIYKSRALKFGVRASRHSIEGEEELGRLSYDLPFSERGWTQQTYELPRFLHSLDNSMRNLGAAQRAETERLKKAIKEYFGGQSPMDFEASMDKERFRYLLSLSKGQLPSWVIVEGGHALLCQVSKVTP